LLQRCVTDLCAQSYQPHEIIVVDNASSDGSGHAIEQAFPQVKVIHAGSNLGFAAGNNLAVKLAAPDSEWIALLNPDAFPEPDWLKALVDAAVAQPEFAIFGSRLMDANTRTLLDGVGDAYHVSGLVWREAHGQPLQPSFLERREIFRPAPPPVCTGAMCSMRLVVLMKIIFAMSRILISAFAISCSATAVCMCRSRLPIMSARR
jgi:GT2 family glycosyltransferase